MKISTMKSKICLFMFFSYFSVAGQDLRNTEWVKTDIRGGTPKASLEYLFKESTVSIILDGHFAFEKGFLVKERILSIENSITYRIDSLNERSLILTEIPRQQKADLRPNTITFINKDAYFQYLIQSNKINYLADTLVQCNGLLLPVYKGESIDKLFMSKFIGNKIKRSLTGYFILSSKGDIERIHVDPSINFSTKEIDKFEKTLLATTGHWLLPKGVGSLYFKTDFELGLDYMVIEKRPISGAGFSLMEKK